MKKVLFFAAAALTMLAACNKTEVVYDNGPQEIAMFAVSNVATKAPVSAETFLENDNMSIAAYLVSGDGVTAGNFFTETEFNKNGNYWTGGRYWPISTATVSFLAVTETGGGKDMVEVTFNGNMASQATVELTNNNVLDQNDVMYAAAQATHTQGAAYTPVPMEFKHALSWINFAVKTNLTSDQAAVTINSIKLNNAVTDGTLTVEYTNYDKVETPSLNAGWSNRTNRGSVVVPNSAANAEAGQQIVTNSFAAYGNGILVLPGESADSFTINYTLDQGGAAQTYDYTYTFTPAVNWKMAHKYTYNISISFTGIEIDPTVKKWETEDATGVSLYK